MTDTIVIAAVKKLSPAAKAALRTMPVGIDFHPRPYAASKLTIANLAKARLIVPKERREGLDSLHTLTILGRLVQRRIEEETPQ